MGERVMHDVMRVHDQELLDSYLVSDRVMELIRSQEGLPPTTCTRWLMEQSPKRLAISRLYWDLLTEVEGLRVVDVGGGLSVFTPLLADRHDYVLVDPLDLDEHAVAEEVFATTSDVCWMPIDWAELEPEPCDVVIANDLFPNVDQRLRMFVDRWRPVSSELRLLVTYFIEPRWYRARREGADEVLTVSAWSKSDVETFLAECDHVDVVLPEPRSIYGNGRQCLDLLL